jgi:putative phage-type endonuclease
MQIINEIDQSSDEWLDLRMGFVTASRFKDVVAKGAGKTRKSYMIEIASEIITGQREEKFNSSYMEWGTETEPQARAMYELETGNIVDEIAFAHFDDVKIGCSPDGLVGDDGLVEFKCPKTTTQIETYLSGKMPTSHKAQVQGQLWVMERKWCDFVSFDPRINGVSGYFMQRIERDDEYIEQLGIECDKFIKELNEMIEKLTN